MLEEAKMKEKVGIIAWQWYYVDVWKYLERQNNETCKASIFIAQDFPFKKTSTTFRSDPGAFLKHGDKHLMQSRYWLWSVPAVLLRRNCRFGFNTKFVHQLWTKQKRGRLREGSFSLTQQCTFFFPGANILGIGQNSQQFFFQRMLRWGPTPGRSVMGPVPGFRVARIELKIWCSVLSLQWGSKKRKTPGRKTIATGYTPKV